MEALSSIVHLPIGVEAIKKEKKEKE